MFIEYKFENPENIGIEEFGQMMMEDSTPISNFPTPFLQTKKGTTFTDAVQVASIPEDDEVSYYDFDA
jgi:hypothetical protein